MTIAPTENPLNPFDAQTSPLDHPPPGPGAQAGGKAGSLRGTGARFVNHPRIRQPANSVPPSAQQAGIHGSIGDVNHKVQAVHDAYTQTNGTPPPTGLVFDIIRSPVPPERYNDLFQLPGTLNAGRLVTQHAQDNPDDILHVDPVTHMIVPYNPLADPGFQQQVAGNTNAPLAPDKFVSTPTQYGGVTTRDLGGLGVTTAVPGNPNNQQTLKILKAKYPMLDSFPMLPIAKVAGTLGISGAEAFIKAITAPNKDPNSPIYAASRGGASIPEMETILKNYAIAQRLNTGGGATPAEQALLGGTGDQAALAQYNKLNDELNNVKTLAGGQQDLNHIWGTNLPANGLWTADWQSAWNKYSRDASAKYSYLQYLAKQGGFSTPEQYEKALKNQQSAMESWGMFWPLAQALGPHAFSGGTGVWDALSQSVENVANATVQFGPLTGLEQSAGLTLSAVAGTVNSFKAGAQAVSAMIHAIAPKWMNTTALVFPAFAPLLYATGQGEHGQGAKMDQALKEAHTILQKNPSWLRIAFPGMPDSQVDSVAGQVVNLLADTLILRKPAFTGEYVPFGSAAIYESPHLNAIIPWAYDYAKNGDLGRAASMINGGNGFKGSWDFMAATEKGIQDGSISLDEFSDLAKEYALKKTIEIDGKTVQGGIANYLHSKQLQTPSVNRLRFDDAARRWTESAQDGLRNSDRVGTDTAANAINSLRSMLTHHATPRGALVRYDPGTPEALYNWVIREFKNPQAATEYESRFVRLLAKNDNAGISALEEEIKAAYDKIKPIVPGKKTNLALPAALEKMTAVLDTEMPQTFYFPHGQYRDPQAATDAWNKLATKWSNRTARFGKVLNGVAIANARLVLVSGGSLLYKHAIADTTKRAYIQGLDALKKDVLSADERQALTQFWADNPLERRRYGVAYLQNRTAETNYMVSPPGRTERPIDFTTGNPTRTIGDREVPIGDKEWQAAAGGYLRRRVDSEVLPAYRQSVAANDWTDLGKAIWQNQDMRHEFINEHRAQIQKLRVIHGLGTDAELDAATASEIKKLEAQIRQMEGLAQAKHLPGKEDLGRYSPGSKIGKLQAEIRSVRNRGKAAPDPAGYNAAILELLKDYAPKIANEFHEFELAATKAGVEDPWMEAAGVLRDTTPHKGDVALGKWIADHSIDFPVRKALVPDKPDGTLATLNYNTARALEAIMVANKWNRGLFFKREFERNWADMVGVGVDPVAAHVAAVNIADTMVKYHMFDFSNRLQIEQSMRFLSYFATKHRLNWKWITTNLVKRPGMAVAINDVAQGLDQNGGFKFSVFGHDFWMPVARLFWVNQQQYPDISALVQATIAGAKALPSQGIGGALTAGFNAAGGTYGNVFTRNDQSGILAAKASYAMMFGMTYQQAVAGLPAAIQKDIWHRLDMFNYQYMHTHKGVPPPESEAVKAVMWAAFDNQLSLSSMFLPVSGVPYVSPQLKPTEQTPFNNADLAKWYSITDPKQKYAFEQAHPDVLNHFGLYQDPKLYVENQAAFAKKTAAQGVRDQKRLAALALAKKTGDAEAFIKVYRQTGADFGKVMSSLEKQYPDWWKKYYASSPLAAAQGDLFKAFPNINKANVVAKAPSKTAIQLANQANYLKKLSTDPSLTASQRSDAKNLYYDALAEQSALSTFPKNAAQATYDKNRNRRDAYTIWSDQQYLHSKTLTGWHAELFQTQYMLLREQKNEPVTIDGIKFPGPATQAFWNYSKPQRDQKLSLWASDNWGHLAGYEKRLLGINAPYDVSEGWYFLNSLIAAYHKQGQSVSKDQKAYLARWINNGGSGNMKPHPDFYRDYQFSLQPKIVRYEATKPFKDLSSQTKAEYELLIAGPAKKYLASGAKAREIHVAWSNYIDTLLPYMKDHAPDLYHLTQDVWPSHLIYELTSS